MRKVIICRKIIIQMQNCSMKLKEKLSEMKGKFRNPFKKAPELKPIVIPKEEPAEKSTDAKENSKEHAPSHKGKGPIPEKTKAGKEKLTSLFLLVLKLPALVTHLTVFSLIDLFFSTNFFLLNW